MKAEKDWIWIMFGLAFGTFLGIMLYPKITKRATLILPDPRVDKIKSLIEEADQLLKKGKKQS